MKKLLLLFITTAAVSGYSKDNDNESVKYPKNITLSLQSPIGITLFQDTKTTKPKLGFGITLFVQKSFHDIQLLGGISFYQTADKKFGVSSSSAYVQYNNFYRSISIPIGVSFKYGHEKHLAYPLVGVSFNPTINIKTSVSGTINTSQSEFYKKDLSKFTMSMSGMLGAGFNVHKHISIEIGGSTWLQFMSISKSQKIRPVLVGGFVGLNYNI